ncbi:MAG: acetyltransferase component of pyruvate dehydrogenase complex [Gammaproteobacteria bacterium]|nr:MAG: acetyltransferase component of pyruvate dehydrogenase complex [Gammaproteobacteria bacterium]
MADTIEIKVPDLGHDEAEVIEVLVKPGDRIGVDDPLITVESDKASMEVPSPAAGTVEAVAVAVGDKVKTGQTILTLKADESGTEKGGAAEPAAAPQAEAASPAKPAPDERAADAPAAAPAPSAAAAPPAVERKADADAPGPRPAPIPSEPIDPAAFRKAHASPAVRKFARELGVDLSRVSGSGPKGRILREDVQRYVKTRLAEAERGAAGGGALPPLPTVDVAAFGPVETQPLSTINKLTGRNLHASWVNIPHVTQFDEADITELEAFRKRLAEEYRERGVKMTPLPFLIKAAVAALKAFPRVNSSLAPDGENLILKRYYHIGIAVDTPDGLVVPVIRDADRKGLVELAEAVMDLATRARNKRLKPDELKGGCFTISSLGGVGGTAFTPIINPPEVAILGVSRAAHKPHWDGERFVPRLMLPLSLSYDHRVIDGVLGARFTRYLAEVLGDLRRLLL